MAVVVVYFQIFKVLLTNTILTRFTLSVNFFSAHWCLYFSRLSLNFRCGLDYLTQFRKSSVKSDTSSSRAGLATCYAGPLSSLPCAEFSFLPPSGLQFCQFFALRHGFFIFASIPSALCCGICSFSAFFFKK